MNTYPKIKICGLTNLDQILELSALEVDYFGFIFYKKSPRYFLNQNSLEELATLNINTKIGVFVNENLEEMTKIIKNARLNFVQLHGEENESYLKSLRNKFPEIKIIRTLKIESESNKKELQKGIEQFENFVDYFLFDTATSSYGGQGLSFNWEILNTLNINKPYFLAGGISLDNINQIKTLEKMPYALDLNSKFENAPGDKNIDLIKSFLLYYQKLTTKAKN